MFRVGNSCACVELYLMLVQLIWRKNLEVQIISHAGHVPLGLKTPEQQANQTVLGPAEVTHLWVTPKKTATSLKAAEIEYFAMCLFSVPPPPTDQDSKSNDKGCSYVDLN